MSNRTKKSLDDDLFLRSLGELKVLEACLNFECVLFQKTCENTADWMNGSAPASAVLPSDWNLLSADGAANAIGSVSEYEVVTRTGRSSAVDFATCYGHQNQRSLLRASGTAVFKTGRTNEELGACLNKSHAIQSRLYRCPTRMKFMNDVQTKKSRKPHMGPMLRNQTRWDSTYDETKRANQIMGDICDTNQILLDEDGADRFLLTAEEVESGNWDRLVYTERDKKILRQYEGIAEPARAFSKFLQDRRNTPSYVLFESRLAIKNTSAKYFAIHPGMFGLMLDVRQYCCTYTFATQTFLIWTGQKIFVAAERRLYLSRDLEHPSVKKFWVTILELKPWTQ